MSRKTSGRSTIMTTAWLMVLAVSCTSAFHGNLHETRFPDVGPVAGHKKSATITANDPYMCLNKECENVPNYPAKDIERIVIDKQLQDFFETKPVPAEKAEIIRYPRLWKVNGTEYTIVQNVSCTSKTGRCYQSVRVVKCKGENKPCSEEHTNILQAGTTTVCEQEYSYSRLLVFNSTNHAVESNIFPIPCGCQCKLIRGSVIPQAKGRFDSLSGIVDADIDPPISRKAKLNFRKPTYETTNTFDYEPDYKPYIKPHYPVPIRKSFYYYDGSYGSIGSKKVPSRSNMNPYWSADDNYEENETF